ncbi:MAG: hypothetical protein Q8O62_10665 [Aequorivita sp.]|nr:hypothetical protein [Aequorivita sp.]
MNKMYIRKAGTFAFFCLFFFFSFNLFAQVGIGTTNPNPNALLDLDASTTPGGLLLPRVALTATNSFSPLTMNVAGMAVYNTATAGVSPNNVTPGYYYNDGAKWVRIAAASVSSSDWTVTGNAGTVAGTGVGQNYLGTTDGQALIIATQATQRMRLLANGQVVINDTGAPLAVDRLTVQGANNEYAINGYASGAAGVGVYAESTSYDAIIGNAARYGVVGLGVYGTYGSGTTYGSYGVVNSATGMGVRAVNQNITGTGLLASGNNFLGNYLGSGSGLAGTGDTGVYGKSNNSTGTGLIGVGNNSSIITISSFGSGVAGTGSKIGVFGYAGNGGVDNGNRGNHGGEFTLDADNDPTTITGNNGNRATAILAGFDNVGPKEGPTGPILNSYDSYYGGYFSGGSESSGTPSYAFVGMRYKTNSNGDGFANGGPGTGRDYKIIGTGVVSTLIEDAAGTPRVLFAPEAPEVVFQDYGIGQLVNGEARIEIDPVFKRGIHVDSESPLKVYVTLEGDCNGVFVTNKSADGFTVRELQGGTSNASFSWQIVATRADTKNAAGQVVSKYVGVRLPEGPRALSVAMKKETEIKVDTSADTIENSIESIKAKSSFKNEVQTKSGNKNSTNTNQETSN